jgi:hypothetical protein
MTENNDLLDLLDGESLKTEFYMEEEVELKTKEVKRAMKSFFKHIQVRSSAATLLLVKFSLLDAAKLNQDTIDKQLNHYVKDLNQDIIHTQKILSDAGINTLAEVSGGLKGTVKITSPTGFQFLNLLKLWDQLNINLVTLYMCQEIGQEEVIKSTHQWTQRIKKFNNLVESLSITAYKAADRLKKQAQEKAVERKKTAHKTNASKPKAEKRVVTEKPVKVATA